MILEGGYAYVVKVIPTVHKATEAFRALPLEKRACRFFDELPDDQESIYSYYTQKSCVFNCMLKDIVRWYKCILYYIHTKIL